jgi:hypothetical protein
MRPLYLLDRMLDGDRPYSKFARRYSPQQPLLSEKSKSFERPSQQHHLRWAHRCNQPDAAAMEIRRALSSLNEHARAR